MPLSYSQNKKHIYAWRENNKDKHLATCRKFQRKYDEWKRIKKIYLNILLE